jgi:hypothetical protein
MRMTIRGCLLILFAAPCFLAAQSSSYGWFGAPGEVYGYGGVRDNHGTVGAGAGLLIAKYGGYFLDAGYSSLGTGSVRRLGEPVTQSRLYDLALLGHIRFPVKTKFEPYAIVGGGAFYNTFQIQAPAPAPFGTFVSKSTTNFAFHTGAGLRYFVHPDWGIRPELKISISGQTYVGFSVGFFYVIPGSY